MNYSSRITTTTTKTTTTNKTNIRVVTVTESKSTERKFNLPIKAIFTALASIFIL